MAVHVLSHKHHPARLAALAAGEKVFEGKPCPHGHPPTRYTSIGTCVECNRLRKLAERGPPIKGRGRPKQFNIELKPEPRKKKVFTPRSAPRPKFIFALSDYHHSLKGRERSRYLNNLLKKV